MDDWQRTGLRMAKEGVLPVTGSVMIPRTELVYKATRAGGAGGQHVNTSSTRIELLWNVRTTTALDAEARTRVEAKLASRLDGEGTLRVVSSSRRSQAQNREAAEARLAELMRGALAVPKRRKPTKPSHGSKLARLDEKKKRGETKRQRRGDGFE
jgi:ribosome-associated protein